MVKLKRIFLALFVCLSTSMYAQKIISDEVIWVGHPYAAFTSLTYYKGYYYCSFREAKKHWDNTGEDCGNVIVICSKDSKNWEVYLTFTDPGFDLRDPQISVTADGRLMLLTEKCQYRDGKVRYRQTCTAFIGMNGESTPLTSIVLDAAQDWNWVWNVNWFDGKAYGFTYAPYFGFVESKDGHTFDMLQKVELSDILTEASIIKLKKGKYIAVVRREKNALIGLYDTKYRLWAWKDAGYRIDCPKLISIKGEIYVLGRFYGDVEQTAVLKLDKKELTLKKIIGIDGEKDCAYPGAVYRNGILYVTYYSGDGKRGDIHLAKIRL